MARIRLAAKAACLNGFKRMTRENGDAVIALLPVQRGMFIAKLLEALERKGVVRAFGFLQAENIGLRGFEKFRDKLDAQAHRIDIPCGQGQAHGFVMCWMLEKDRPDAAIAPLSARCCCNRYSRS